MKLFRLLAGDIFFFYFGLFLTLLLRYQLDFYEELIQRHLLPFSIIFIVWLLVFYIAGLYNRRLLHNNLDFFKVLILTLFINAILAVLFFYFIPAFGITPKTNLFIFIGIYGILEIIWRRYFNSIASASGPLSEMALIGNSETSRMIDEFLEKNPQLGYEIKYKFKEHLSADEISRLQKLAAGGEIEILITPHGFKKDSGFAGILYEFLTSGIVVKDLPSFYETIFQKVPLAEINEEWLLENLTAERRFYDGLKRGAEILLASILSIIFLPLLTLLAVLIKIFSPGPAIYKQTRIGRRGREFQLYKFRTMNPDAEKYGPQWAKENDKRVTFIGKILRRTHLDELPQLINILKGDLSFVGPRPERPGFVNLLRKKIPYYDIRHLVKPGVTGSAQLNYRYGASVEDAYKKLEYDIYYIKNRSLILDLSIVLRTVKLLFVNPE